MPGRVVVIGRACTDEHGQPVPFGTYGMCIGWRGNDLIVEIDGDPPRLAYLAPKHVVQRDRRAYSSRNSMTP